MTTKTWWRTSLTALVLAAAVATPAGTALAAPAGGDARGVDAISLSWDGSEYAASTSESFLGVPVSVPGDTAARTLTVRNDGPRQGVLTAEIVNVELLDPEAPDEHHNPDHEDPDGSGAPFGDPYAGAGDQGDFYDDVTVGWETADGAGSASFSALDTDGGRQIGQVALGRGETTEVTISYEFPYDATSGNRANVPPRLASFDVLLTIRGDDAAAPPARPGRPGRPSLSTTGADVLWLGAAAVLAVVTGNELRRRAGRTRQRDATA
ncbi:hypothetical protein ATJ97_2975 [Georgenia soli]|uniref:LPXTG-motif cell wall-anchored protein n=1 Tax=Georgenia soli TaxID=638953 RepID=A0A2A9EPB7_9MICO|nr:hypothetical protein [Georgenia soli]PFG40446.1 hypothetical protein ATJ97_2975 [Georgenia soli]